jgi:hypothetical protein
MSVIFLCEDITYGLPCRERQSYQVATLRDRLREDYPHKIICVTKAFFVTFNMVTASRLR